jgi:hypothetical protein
MRRVAAACVCISAGLLLAGCGGGDDDPRARVEGYVTRVNDLQQRYAGDFDQANKAYVEYSQGKLEGKEAEAGLTRAHDAIVDARGRLEKIAPPPEARRLHERLLRFYDMNIAFADQTALLASYLREAPATLRRLPAVNRTLSRRLRAADDPAEQQRALERFGTALTGMLRKLRALEVPDVLRPNHREQVSRLTATRSLAADLREAIAARDAERVARLLLRFRRGGSSLRGPAARAIAQYNRRYRRLSEAAVAVQREQARLNRSLGVI